VNGAIPCGRSLAPGSIGFNDFGIDIAIRE